MDYQHFRIQLGNKVREIRTGKGLTQEQMEEGEFGVPYRTIQDVETKETEIRIKTIFRIAKRLDVDPKELLDLE